MLDILLPYNSTITVADNYPTHLKVNVHPKTRTKYPVKKTHAQNSRKLCGIFFFFFLAPSNSQPSKALRGELPSGKKGRVTLVCKVQASQGASGGTGFCFH